MLPAIIFKSSGFALATWTRTTASLGCKLRRWVSPIVTTSGPPKTLKCAAFMVASNDMGWSGLLRELPKLEEEAEPVLHMPRRGDSLATQVVEVVNTEAHPFIGRGDAKKLALMSAADLGANADPAGFLDHVVNGDLNVREGLDDAADDGLDAFRPGILTGCQRNVVPSRSEDFIDKIGVLVAERSVERFYNLAFRTKPIS